MLRIRDYFQRTPREPPLISGLHDPSFVQLYFFNRRSNENRVSPSCLAARLLL